MQVLKGAEVSAKIKEEVQGLLASVEGPAPKLAIVRVGERPDDMSYERGAIKKKWKILGYESNPMYFPGTSAMQNSRSISRPLTGIRTWLGFYC